MKGKRISKYLITEKLGSGGMGVVYEATDTMLDRTVALKFLPPHLTNDENAKKRFFQEAKAASALDHPNICTIHEIGESSDGSLFITMAYYEGESLEESLKKGIPEYEKALDIAIQLSKGLACAHQSSITHRDIKPGNIMITERGDVKIVDFGLAKLADTSQLTKTGATVGTAAYMAPEQISGGTVDQRSDIFSCGTVLYELFTGIHPFKSDYYHGIMYAVMNDDPAPVNEINPDLPVELAWIIEKALEKDPNDRFQDMDEMVQFLESLKSGNVENKKLAFEKLGMELSKPESFFSKSRRRLLTGLGIAIILLVTAIIIWNPSVVPIPDNNFISASTIPVNKQIAVLPFRIIGDQPENESFADGLVEILTSKLSQLEQFQDQYLVVPTSETSSRNIRSAGEAHEAFGVNLVVTGSIQQLERGVRVTINLIDAQTLRQLDSKIIDDTFIEKSVLQDEAVFNLASMLEIELQPEARRILTAGGTSEPGAYEFYLRGIGHLHRFDQIDEINAAIEQFKRSLQEDPEFARAYAGLSDAYLTLYRRTENTEWLEPAIENIDKAIEITDELSPVFTTYGLLLIEKGEYEEAQKMLQRALEIDPVNFEAYRGRARAFLAQQRVTEAEATYHKAIEMKPDYWAGYSELGVFYYQNGKFEKAADQFRIVTELTPKNASAFRNLGGIYYYLGREEEAIKAFHKSVEIEPNYGAYSNLATLYYSNEEFNEAAGMYSKALELNDNDYRVWSYLASAYKRSTPPLEDEYLETMRKAKDLAERKLEVNPRDPQVLVSLAGFNSALGNKETAQKLLARAVKLEPSDINVQMNIGTTYEYLGNRDMALKWIEKAFENGYLLDEFNKNTDVNLSELREDVRFVEIINRYSDSKE
ncbi:protein kinase [Balneolaceae bacterium YR4-1]|uniref:non-specific serine/threonine protein kinase n=1 Tax=Halalkalibaculum roseum TaxID=2709311 RepID=A0A6M1SSN2_9BACT|nr:serine/threonine-protein kinase [Halalkalibaculum roseum]NGP75098.1 protein kinase [Halalkalibaculum roseum]